MKVTELSVEQLRALIEDMIEEKLQEYLGDPDEGLELREEIIQRLKAHQTSRKSRIPMQQVAERHGFKLE